jgi:hypothetical protein
MSTRVAATTAMTLLRNISVSFQVDEELTVGHQLLAICLVFFPCLGERHPSLEESLCNSKFGQVANQTGNNG